jgi:GTP-binding nuclear protein Ran
VRSDKSLTLVEEVAKAPAEVAIDQGLMDQYQNEIQQAAALPIPADDDDDF